MDKDNKATQTQVGGEHYSKLAIQPVTYIEENHLGYCEDNVIKYVTRHRDKGGKQDILKAKQYLDFILERDYPDEDTSAGVTVKSETGEVIDFQGQMPQRFG